MPADLPPSLVSQIKRLTRARPIEHELLGDIYRIAHSPLFSGAALDVLLSFFSALVTADDQIATHLVPGLVIAESTRVTAGTIAAYSKYIKQSSKAKTSSAVLFLLILGEPGRFIDMFPQQDVFNNVMDHFSSEQEGIRTATAFSAGAYPIPARGLFASSLFLQALCT
ncbi:hypothetical protein EDC04DRAFT_2909983 [Pisolithus marmoratus]|nr:hypothetical protein EDC04DRAFT_2909983 [Pisolithus marmoratus]